MMMEQHTKLLPLTLYKKSASMRLEIMQPHYDSTASGSKLKGGAVFMSIARAVGDKKYDVENASLVALNSGEVAKLLYAIDTDFESLPENILGLFHKYGEKTTKINIGRSKKQPGTYGWQISSGEVSNASFTDKVENYMVALYLRTHYNKLYEVDYDYNTRGNRTTSAESAE